MIKWVFNLTEVMNKLVCILTVVIIKWVVILTEVMLKRVGNLTKG